MKVYWSIEGVGCQFQRCGNKLHLLEIESDEAEDMTPAQRKAFIDEAVEDEFKKIVYPMWEEKHGED